jgi:hypothetical protein
MLPVNVPYAALSLSPHYLYGQTFHVEGRARDPTTFALEISARAKALKAMDTVLVSNRVICQPGCRSPEGEQEVQWRVQTVRTFPTITPV